MDKEDLSFIIPQKEIRIRKSWGSVNPETKVKHSEKVYKRKREQNNLRKQIDEALYEDE
jgi:hypothetical protein